MRRSQRRRSVGFIVAAACVAWAGGASAQQAAAPDGAKLFKNQCATCHTLKAADGPRQGPTLEKIVGRKPGTVEGFKYSAGFAKADFLWDEAHLDTWLANPQAMIPGAIMPYKQAKADVRKAIVDYLKDPQ